jgi:MvdD family ATP-grasp ribosomal peptide maturase
MTVLIVTRSDDNECIEYVTKAIGERGGRAFRFDTDRFPTDTTIAAQYGGTDDSIVIRNGHDEVELRSVSAVWYRRTRVGGGLPRDMDKQLFEGSVKESKTVALGLVSALDVFHMDRVVRIRHAANKQLQLRLARSIGLATPRTLVSNDPAAVRAFAKKCPEGMITKMLSSFAVFDEEGREQVVFTSPVNETHLDHLDELKYCPMTFQEKVPKAVELRVTVVGDRIFCASIDPHMSDRADHDWRRDGTGLVDQWQHYDLPADVGAGLLKLVDQLGLNYSAIDVIVTPDGRHVFLELNPVGEYFWLEQWPGLPISEAIADVLLDRAFRRA